MRVVLAVVIGLVAGAVVGVILGAALGTVMPKMAYAVVNPVTLGIVGAVVAPLVYVRTRRKA